MSAIGRWLPSLTSTAISMLCRELRPGKDVGGLERRLVVSGGKLPSVFYVRQVTHDASLVLFCSRSFNGIGVFFCHCTVAVASKFDIHFWVDLCC